MKRLLYFFLLIPITLTGQRYISGQIIDAENGEPVAGAAVFISNTSIGVITDVEGFYQLAIPGEGSYELTISHVGYQSVFKDIEPGTASVEFNAFFDVVELDEVTMVAKVRSRQKDINLFLRTILGKYPSRRTIRITNPGSVYYFYNSETQTLRVTCREPLQIINYETGYQIHYLLNHFTHDYANDVTDWSNQFIFTELESDNLRQKRNWDKKRQEVYHTSLAKFIKSLYNSSLYNDGFVLASFRKHPDPRNPFQISLIDSESILSRKSADNSRILNFSDEQVILICYGRPVTSGDLNKIAYIQDEKFVKNNGLLLNLLYGDSIRIYPDGTFANKLLMAPVFASNSLLGLNMSLPLDYLPDNLALSAVKHEMTFDFNDVIQHFDTQMRVFPQEKIHLHTDRDYYVPGEKIWFKAYLTDAATLQSTTNSRFIYAELIDARDSLVNRIMIRPENEMYYGHLFLSDVISEGNYTLRAYTRYMENLGDDYFFKKNIRIKAPPQPSPIGRELRNPGYFSNHKNPGPDYDVSFFPEGGNLLEGTICKVAFKALNQNGYAETITGEIVDESGTVITSLQTFYAGMGIFSFLPENGKRYFLHCRSESGLKKQFELPHAETRACALNVTQRNKRISVGISQSAQSPADPLFLLALCRGMEVFFLSWDRAKESVSFLEEDLPAGIIQLILFDEQMNPLSERLVFNKNSNIEAKIEFQTDKEIYQKREKVIVTLKSPALSGRAGEGLSHLSVAITDDNDVAVDSSTTILSSLLLSSEIKGYIENPAYYLQDNAESAVALDYLMMTHGWRRYDIPEVIKGNYITPQIPYQISQEISGKVKSPFLSRPVPNSEISILTKAGFWDITSTNERGAFLFRDFEYPDSTSYFIQALNRRGSNQVELVIDTERFPPLIHAPQSPFLRQQSIDKDIKDEPVENAFLVKAEQRSRYDEDMRLVHLNEVVVTAPRIDRKEERRLEYVPNMGSDVTIRREVFEKTNPTLVSDLLRFASGVSVAGNGEITIMKGEKGNPLVLIDGIEIPWPEDPLSSPYDSPLERVNVLDVESIDVFKGGSTAMFGVRGFYGVISITTKYGIGDENKNKGFNTFVITPLGYQTPVEFYAPRYETLTSINLTIPDYRTTIFWKPDVVISDEGEATFDFYTSDFPTTYSVVIEGLTAAGNIVREVGKIVVE